MENNKSKVRTRGALSFGPCIAELLFAENSIISLRLWDHHTGAKKASSELYM